MGEPSRSTQKIKGNMEKAINIIFCQQKNSDQLKESMKLGAWAKPTGTLQKNRLVCIPIQLLPPISYKT